MYHSGGDSKSGGGSTLCEGGGCMGKSLHLVQFTVNLKVL